MQKYETVGEFLKVLTQQFTARDDMAVLKEKTGKKKKGDSL